MHCTHIFTSRPVNPGRQIDRSTGEQMNMYVIGPELNIEVQGIMGMPYLFAYRPVNLSTRVDRSRGKYMSARAFTPRPVNPGRQVDKYGLPIMPCIDIFTSQPFYLLTVLPGLIGPELNIEVQGIMGIPYLFTCQPVFQG